MKRSKFPELVLLGGLAACGSGVVAQTTIDLRTQSKSVDFSTASSTKPMRTGTTLPATCVLGELYFKSNAPSGANIYGCVAANIWAVESGGGSSSGEANTASNAGALGVGVFLQKSGVDLQFKNVNAASSRLSVSNDAVNATVNLDVVPANLDLSAMGGSLAAGQIGASSKQGNGSKLVAFGGGTVAADDCAKFDASGNIVGAGAACGSGGGDVVGSDLGIIVTTIGAGNKKIGVDTSVVPSYLTGTASLDFPSIAQSSCGELTIAVAGAMTGDAVAPGLPNTIESGLAVTMFVSAQNTVTVRACKITSGAVDPLASAFRATIVRSF